MSKHYYFPTRVGTKWTYDDSLREGFGDVVTESTEKNGQYAVTVKSTSLNWVDTNETTISLYAVSKDGVYWVASGLEAEETRTVFDQPYCLLKLPHTTGEKWGGDAKAKEPEMVAGKVETVKVPAGTFEAIRVDQGLTCTYWYAPGVGLIKRRINDRVIQMKSFTPPKD